MKLYRAPGRWKVESEWPDRIRLRKSGLTWDPAERVWWTRSDHVARLLIDAATPEARLELDNSRRIADWRFGMSSATEPCGGIKLPCPDGLQYLPYQKAAIEYASKTGRGVLIADEPGLGKTVQALGICNLTANVGVQRVLVICPAGVRLHWIHEIRRWSMSPENRLVDAVASRRDIEGALRRNAVFCVVTWDLLKDFNAAAGGTNWNTVIADEAHYAKEPRTARAVALRDICERSGQPVFLTGTPICNYPKELFGLLDILRPGLFNSYPRYAERYCDRKWNGHRWDDSGASNLHELHRIVRSECMVRRLKKDVMQGLPAKRRLLHEIEPDTQALRDCLDASKHSGQLSLAFDETDLSDTWDEAKRALMPAEASEITKWRRQTALAKAPQVAARVSELVRSGEKVLVFGWHKEAIADLVERLASFKPVSVTGSTPQDARARRLEMFRSDPTCKVAVCNIQAVGVGLSIEHVRHVVMAETSWRPADMWQAEDRAHRIGQDSEVTVHYCVVAGTVEAYMYKRFFEKQRVIDQALDGKGD